jgi:hypothetical protein
MQDPIELSANVYYIQYIGDVGQILATEAVYKVASMFQVNLDKESGSK